MKVVFDIYEKLNRFLKKQNLEKIYAWTFIIVAIVVVIPMLLISFVNVPNLTDDIGHTTATHITWMRDHSVHGFFMTVVAAWKRMVEIYLTWGVTIPVSFSQLCHLLYLVKNLHLLEPLCL